MVDENGNGAPNGNGNGLPNGKGISPITGYAPPPEHKFSAENQPRREGDVMTRCLRAYLSQKAGPDGKTPRDDIRVLGKFPPRMLSVARELVEAATDKESRAFGQAQRVIWERASGRPPQEHQHSFPNVSESITVNPDRVNAPMPHEEN